MSEDVYSLLAVLDYYGINMDNIPSIKQDRLVSYAEYNDMASVLNFLIKETSFIPVLAKVLMVGIPHRISL